MTLVLLGVTTLLGALIGIPLLVAALGLTRLPSRELAISSHSLAPGGDTALDRALLPLLQTHTAESGAFLVEDNMEAFVLRALSARKAERSLDVQSYIWHDDTTGRLLANELLAAADRGVRVRLLLDDMDARRHNFALAALDAHPHIAVRVFNPFRSRDSLAGQLMETFTGFSRINRRMHNKTWLVDGRLALAGGRNVGNEYFGAAPGARFLDLDLAIIGPAVDDGAGVFDRYWNAAAAYPMSLLNPQRVASTALATLRQTLRATVRTELDGPYLGALQASSAVAHLLEGRVDLVWTRRWSLLADDPNKVRGDGTADGSQVLAELLPLVEGAHEQVTLISPYFVPGEAGTAVLRSARLRGVGVRILTNSLAANDVAAVHAGYRRYRDRLLEGNVDLWELKPGGSATSTSWFGSSHVSLHTKALAVDHRWLFVGSFNLDPRSVSLNCEQGLLLDAPALARALEQRIERDLPAIAWRLERDQRGEATWRSGEKTLRHEPLAPWGRRMLVWLTRRLPIESQL